MSHMNMAMAKLPPLLDEQSTFFSQVLSDPSNVVNGL